MSFKKEWALGDWASRTTLTYTDLDKSITHNGVNYFCDQYGRISIRRESGAPRPITNFDDTTTENVWYMRFESDDFQVIFRTTFTE